jgi:hypothetical protein
MTETGQPARAAGVRTALVIATLLALVPWAGLLTDAVAGSDDPPGTPTTANCDTALCLHSVSHVVLTDTLVPAAICAGLAVALAAAVLVRRRGLWWPAGVIVLAVVAISLYALLV